MSDKADLRRTSFRVAVMHRVRVSRPPTVFVGRHAAGGSMGRECGNPLSLNRLRTLGESSCLLARGETFRDGVTTLPELRRPWGFVQYSVTVVMTHRKTRWLKSGA